MRHCDAARLGAVFELHVTANLRHHVPSAVDKLTDHFSAAHSRSFPIIHTTSHPEFRGGAPNLKAWMSALCLRYPPLCHGLIGYFGSRMEGWRASSRIWNGSAS